MKYQKLGKTDLNASVVAFGAWGIGAGIVWPDIRFRESSTSCFTARALVSLLTV